MRLIASAALCLAVGGVALADEQSAVIPERPSRFFTDATLTHLPASPALHAMEAAALDADGDGDLDLAIAVEYGVNRLYLNDGNGRFTWVRGALGTTMHDSEHVRAADFDRDGAMDLVFVAESDEVHQLFLGDGKGGFRDASDRLPARSQGNGLAVGDVNGDGMVDIVVGNTGEAGPGRAERPARNFLWLGDRRRPGYFIDATARALPDTDDQSEGIALADMDGDGDLDMLVASATRANRLLLNDGRGRFSDASDRLELKVPMETRMVHAFDANGDQRPDILFSNLTSNAAGWVKDPQTRLLINDGQGRWRDETAERLPAHRFSSWASTIIDFDRDGDMDIVAGAIEVPGFVPLQPRAWRNDGTGRFADATLEAIPGITVGRTWNMTQGDFDGDGKTDLFIGGWGTQARLLLTDGAKARSFSPRFEVLRPASR
jgi:hypothetical protein